MITSTIKFSQIEDRIDAEYYKPEYFEIYNNLEKKKDSILLEDIAKEIVSGSYIDTYFPQGVIYLRVNNLREDGFNFSDIKYVDIKYSKIHQKIRVHTNDLVLGRTGTVGVVLVIPNELDGAVMSQHITKIVPKDTINRFYLMVYLNSKYGRLQAEKTALGSMQKELTLDATENIKVSIPSKSFQQKIENMVKERQGKQRLADEKYKEAEEILNKELGLKKLDLSRQKTFETKFSETNERIDSEHYQPIFNEIEQVFKKQTTVNLGDINLEIKYGTSEDLFYVEKGIPFLRVTDINKFSTIEPMKGKFINNFDAERLKEYQVKTDDIIISRTGTLGLAVYIDEKLDGAIYGSYFIKVKPRHKDLYNRFIVFFISSEIGRLQTNRWASGGIQTNLTIDAIKSIRIPILSRPIQQRICSLIQDSLKLREETENLLNEAKQKVEKMVLGE